MNQKTIQALDALAEKHTAFEASMKKVTSEHDEEGDVLYAVATELTDELERAQKDQDRLQDELDCSCEDTELIEKWQHQLQDGHPVSRAPSEHGEVILIELQW